MANIVITAVGGTTRHKVTSNDVDTGWDYQFIWTDSIIDFHVNGVVHLTLATGVEWELTLDGSDGTWQVDTVLGVTPANLDALATAIADLKG